MKTVRPRTEATTAEDAVSATAVLIDDRCSMVHVFGEEEM